jgi:hypothetical protein
VGLEQRPEETALEVSITVTPEGEVTVTLSDEAGYSPDPLDDMCSRARTTALDAHRELYPAKKPKKGT